MEEEPVNHELDVFLPHIFTGKYFITTIEPSNCMINQVPMQPSRFSYWLHVLSLDVHAARGVGTPHAARGVGTPHNGLYGEAPPERGTFFRLQVYKRIGISQVEVFKRVRKLVI